MCGPTLSISVFPLPLAPFLMPTAFSLFPGWSVFLVSGWVESSYKSSWSGLCHHPHLSLPPFGEESFEKGHQRLHWLQCREWHVTKLAPGQLEPPHPQERENLQGPGITTPHNLLSELPSSQALASSALPLCLGCCLPLPWSLAPKTTPNQSNLRPWQPQLSPSIWPHPLLSSSPSPTPPSHAKPQSCF